MLPFQILYQLPLHYHF